LFEIHIRFSGNSLIQVEDSRHFAKQ